MPRQSFPDDLVVPFPHLSGEALLDAQRAASEQIEAGLGSSPHVRATKTIEPPCSRTNSQGRHWPADLVET